MPLSVDAATSQPGAVLWQEAVSFAARAHRHQVRKDGRTPYVAHVVRVALTVRDVFAEPDPSVLAIALLHDTIEDTTTDFDDLADRFGPDIARGVAALTKNMALPEDERERDYDERLARADWRARLVKLADTFDNLSDTASGQGTSLPRAVARCRRAVELARPDASRDSVRRAIDAVEALVARLGA